MSTISETTGPADVVHPIWCDPAACLYGVEDHLRDSAHRTVGQRFQFEDHEGFGVSFELIQYHGQHATLWVDEGLSSGGSECTPDDLEACAAWLLERAAEYRAMLEVTR